MASLSGTARLSVTVLSGFLVAGKTNLVNHILTNKERLGEWLSLTTRAGVNIDAALVEGVNLLRRDETLVEMSKQLDLLYAPRRPLAGGAATRGGALL